MRTPEEVAREWITDVQGEYPYTEDVDSLADLIRARDAEVRAEAQPPSAPAMPAAPPTQDDPTLRTTVRDRVMAVLLEAELPGEGISFVLAYQTETLHDHGDHLDEANVYGWLSHGSLATTLGIAHLVRMDIERAIAERHPYR